MFNTIEEYLDALKDEMKDADPALVQDAQADAREHLTLALKATKEKQPEVSDADALRVIIDGYGSPEETALAYREVERRTSPVLAQPTKPRSFLGRFFGVYTDPRAWGALLYMFIAFVTGIFYFTWAVTGVSVSVSFLIFIFGFPFALLFLLSVRGLALLEGRLVEALLGVRMPRRPLFSHQGMKWLDAPQSAGHGQANLAHDPLYVDPVCIGNRVFCVDRNCAECLLIVHRHPCFAGNLPTGCNYVGEWGALCFPNLDVSFVGVRRTPVVDDLHEHCAWSWTIAWKTGEVDIGRRIREIDLKQKQPGCIGLFLFSFDIYGLMNKPR